jgi:hypothetical protein
MIKATYQGQSVQSLGVASLLQNGPQLEDLGILHCVGVTRVSRGIVGSDNREVEVIILRVEVG